MKIMRKMIFTGVFAFMMIAPGFLPASAQGGNPHTYVPSADQEELDPRTIPKFAQELSIPRVFAPAVIRGKYGQVIRNEYVVSTAHTGVQMLPPPFPMTTVPGYGGKVKIPEGVSKEVLINAKYEGKAVQVEISQ